MNEHLFSLLTPHLPAPTLARTAAASCALYSPSILALYRHLDLSHPHCLPGHFLDPRGRSMPHMQHVRTLTSPSVLLYTPERWRAGLGLMKGLEKVIVAHEWDAFPAMARDGPSAKGPGWLGDAAGATALEPGRTGEAIRMDGIAHIFGLRMSRSTKKSAEVTGTASDAWGVDTQERKRRLELEVRGASSPLAALPPGTQMTDILSNTETLTLRLARGIPVIREAPADYEGEGEEASGISVGGSAESSEREGSKLITAVDYRRSVLTALQEHPNIRHLRIILPVSMFRKQRSVLHDSLIHYRHISAPHIQAALQRQAAALRLAAAFFGADDGDDWKHLDLQHDLVHLIKQIPARCRLDIAFPVEAERETWPRELWESANEQLGDEVGVEKARWSVEGNGQVGILAGRAKL